MHTIFFKREYIGVKYKRVIFPLTHDTIWNLKRETDSAYT